jgi:hypothetical protein
MRSTIRDTFDLGKEAFWRDVFFDRRFLQRLYMEALGCESFEVVAESGDLGSGLTRRLRFTQKIDAPAPVRKLFGETTTMEEDGRFDPQAGVWRYRMIPSKMPDKVSISGTTSLEPDGEHRVTRVAELDFAVSIFGVGGLVEKYMAKQTTESMERQARFTRAYIAEISGRA